MNIEGQITIRLQQQAQGIQQVRIESSRPVHAAKVFIGKTPETALQMIPLLFSVCSNAQSQAALTAIQLASQHTLHAPSDHARDIIVLSETAKEHILRIQLDWPPLFKQDTPTKALPYTSRIIHSFKQALFQNADAFSLDSQLKLNQARLKTAIQHLEEYLEQWIFHIPLQQWLNIHSIDALNQWAHTHQNHISAYSLQQICHHGWGSQAHSNSQHLPALDEPQFIEQLEQQADHFIAQPQWQGEHYETNALSRQQQQPLIQQLLNEFTNGLITRWTARLVELARIPQQMREKLQYIKQNQAHPNAQQRIAQVEAARGRLIHRVLLNNNTISNYQIVAPTEWNFHPHGLIKHSLLNIQTNSKQESEQLARLTINAIDPCVAYQLSIH